MPEVCFVGRSNVGKSSFINTLLNRKNLARVGATPGKTREINFYNIDDKLYFVDLPGYGFATVSKTKKKVWGGMVDTYLTSRHQLKLIIMLVDIRHKPSNDDILMYEWLSAFEAPYLIIATKADKISRSQINVRLREIKKTLNLNDSIQIVPFSSETKLGKDEVWKEIDSIITDTSSSV
jgi:GTP-binding protein